MGILRLWNSVDLIFPSCVFDMNTTEATKKVAEMRVDHLFFDLNNLLYNFSSSYNKEIFFVRLFKNISETIKTFTPRSTVYFALDGPAPLAKMCTQIERRAAKGDSQEDLEGDEAIHPLMFTPGTSFMAELKEMLVQYSVQQLAVAYPDVQFYVSGADRTGEGEAKIFQHIVNNLPKNKRSNCVVISNDSDLLLFGLRNRYHNFYTLRTKVPRKQGWLYDISILRKALFEKLGNTNESVLDDFCLMCLLSGNDYLPKMYSWSLSWAIADYQRYIKLYPNESLWSETKGINYELFHNLFNHRHAAHFNVSLLDLTPKTLLMRLNMEHFDQHHLEFFCSDSINGAYKCDIILGKEVIASASHVKQKIAVLLASMEIINHPDKLVNKLPNNIASVITKTLDEFREKFNADLANTLNDSTVDDKQSQPAELQEATKTPAEEEAAELVAEELEAEREEVIEEGVVSSFSQGFHDRARKYVEGIYWIMSYLKGEVLNFTFIYPYFDSPSKKAFIAAAEPVPPIRANPAHPLTPMQFVLALMPKAGLHLVPNSVREIAEVELQELHQESSVKQLTTLWRLDMDKWLNKVRAIIDKAPKDQWTDVERSQLGCQPTLKIWKTPLQEAPNVSIERPKLILPQKRPLTVAKYTQIFREAEPGPGALFVPRMESYPDPVRSSLAQVTPRQFSTWASPVSSHIQVVARTQRPLFPSRTTLLGFGLRLLMKK